MKKISFLKVAQKGPAGLLGGLLYRSAKPTGYKAPEIPRNETYVEVRRNDEG
jgi:hypothetical protein